MSQPSAHFVYPRPGIPQPEDPIPSWLCERLHNLDGVHSLGTGLHNMLLNCYFPATSNFMVKPISRGSAFTSCEPVETNQNDDDALEFMVCKSGADLHADVPILIWRLKRDDPAASRMMTKVERYRLLVSAYRARRADSPHPVILAVVEKALVKISMLTSESGDIVEMQHVNILDPMLHKFLVHLRVQ